MSWTAYQVTFQLESPLHSGFAKIGNIQRTRLYATGRMLWGALTSQLARMHGSNDYFGVGQLVHQYLSFSYFYVTFSSDGSQPFLPFYDLKLGLAFRWGDVLLTSREVERLCLSSYASTGLDYTRNAAEEGSLHEVEIISPRILCDFRHVKAGDKVYLTGYIFEDNSAKDNDITNSWQDALSEVQFGGERTYGFGRLKATWQDQQPQPSDLFGYKIILDHERPIVIVPAGSPMLAHTDANQAEQEFIGAVEPMVGRETHQDGAFGKYPSEARICWQPGSFSPSEQTFGIKEFGLWKTETVVPQAG